MLMNREQVKALFAKEAVSFGDFDAVPLRRVAELFGEDAARYGDQPGTDGNRNIAVFTAGPYQIHYINAAGFYRAAAYRNTLEIGQREEQEDKPE